MTACVDRLQAVELMMRIRVVCQKMMFGFLARAGQSCRMPAVQNVQQFTVKYLTMTKDNLCLNFIYGLIINISVGVLEPFKCHIEREMRRAFES